jgi:teichuronic acid biosynthesis glycosyltransferase TuaC
MRVLFVSSGNKAKGISSIVKRQGDSLEKKGIKIYYYKIQGKGMQGYLANIKPLKNFIKQIQPDIIHAHYLHSGVLASLSGAKPLIVSLMGSDVKSSGLFKLMVCIFSYLFWSHTIVKSKDMQKSLWLNKTHVIPNGINQKVFSVIDKNQACVKLGWDKLKRHILFAANPNRLEKNFKLAQNAVKNLYEQIELHTLSDIAPDKVPVMMNASDVILLTSKWEGSPNVIKEAMACNRPVVATDVGDIRWLFGNEPGHYLSSFDAKDMAGKIKQALEFTEKYGRTRGRERIIKLGLDAEMVARRLVGIYEEAIAMRL